MGALDNPNGEQGLRTGNLERAALQKAVERHLAQPKNADESNETLGRLKEHFSQLLGVDGAIVNLPNIGGSASDPIPTQQRTEKVHFWRGGIFVARRMVVAGGASTIVV